MNTELNKFTPGNEVAEAKLQAALARLREEKALLVEVVQQLIACHDEPRCPALDVARAALAKVGADHD